MLAGIALIMDIMAVLDADTWAWVCDPPTGSTSLMQDAEAAAASRINICLMYFFIPYPVLEGQIDTE